MQKTLRIFNLLDWFVAIGTLLVGLVLLNGWVLAGGAFGLAMAWYKPAERIKKRLESKFLRKKSPRDDSAAVLAEDAFYDQALKGTSRVEEASAPSPAATEAPAAVPDFRRGPRGYSGVFLHPSRHNQLKQAHLNLARQPDKTTWC